MRITIEYGTQVRSAGSIGVETLEVDHGTTAAELLKQLAETRSSVVGPWLTEDFRPRPGLLVFINDETPTDLEATALCAGDQVALLTLVSGG